MAIVKELIDGRTYETDLNDARSGTRRFVVLECRVPHAAAAAFEAEATAQVYPGFINPLTQEPLLVLHSYTMRSEGGTAGWFIDATYKPVLPIIGTRYYWEYVKLTQEMPLAAPVVITPPSGSNASRQLVYGYQTVPIAEKRIRRSVKVGKKYSGIGTDTALQLDYIATQIDKLHSIFGKLHLFVGADVVSDERDRNLFTITYTWELDNGTPYPPYPIYQEVGEPLNQSVDVVIRPDYVNGEDTSLWRPAYSKLIPYPNTEPQLFPRATLFYPYDLEPDGWLRLPGIDTL